MKEYQKKTGYKFDCDLPLKQWGKQWVSAIFFTPKGCDLLTRKYKALRSAGSAASLLSTLNWHSSLSPPTPHPPPQISHFESSPLQKGFYRNRQKPRAWQAKFACMVCSLKYVEWANTDGKDPNALRRRHTPVLSPVDSTNSSAAPRGSPQRKIILSNLEAPADPTLRKQAGTVVALGSFKWFRQKVMCVTCIHTRSYCDSSARFAKIN